MPGSCRSNNILGGSENNPLSSFLKKHTSTDIGSTKSGGATGGEIYTFDTENSSHIFIIAVLVLLLMCILYIVYMKACALKNPQSIIPVMMHL